MKYPGYLDLPHPAKRRPGSVQNPVYADQKIGVAVIITKYTVYCIRVDIHFLLTVSCGRAVRRLSFRKFNWKKYKIYQFVIV